MQTNVREIEELTIPLSKVTLGTDTSGQPAIMLKTKYITF